MAGLVAVAYVLLVIVGRYAFFVAYLLAIGGPFYIRKEPRIFWVNLLVASICAPLLYLQLSPKRRILLASVLPAIVGGGFWSIEGINAREPGYSFLSAFHLGTLAIVITSWLVAGVLGSFAAQYIFERVGAGSDKAS